MEVTSGQEPSRKRWLHAHCIVEGCQNGRKKNPQMVFHILPTQDPTRLKHWLVSLNLDLNTPTRKLQGHSVCSKHFLRSDYRSTPYRPILNHDAVPSVDINTQPMMDKKRQAVLKSWEETAVRPALSDDEPVMECDEDELEPLTLSSEEDEDHTDPTGSSVHEESQETQEQENNELLEDQELLLFAPIEEEDNEEENQEEENQEVQVEESSTAGDAGLHHEEEYPPLDWTAPAPKRTRLHSPERLPHGPQSSASCRSLTGFKLNGSHVPLQPVGGGVKLKLISRTGGSACGFTCIKLIPITTSSTPVHTSNSKSTPVHLYNNITLVHTSKSKTTPVHLYNNITPVHTSNSKTTPVHDYNNITPVHTSNSKTTPVDDYNNITPVHISNPSKPFTSSNPPKSNSFPVITGVVCGSAAEVLSRRTVNSSYNAPLMRMTDVVCSPTAKQVVRSCIASLPPCPVLSSPPPQEGWRYHTISHHITPVHTSNSKTTPVHDYNNITPVHISNPSKPFTSSNPPKSNSFPVITGVVCGSAAEVLSRRTVNSSYNAPLMRMTDLVCSPTAKQVVRSCIASLPPCPVLSSPPPQVVQPQIPTPSGPQAHSLHSDSSPESVFSIRGRPLKPNGPDSVKPLPKGLCGQVRPPDCTVCKSQYKMVSSLRGFVCLCSIEIIQCLRQAQRFKRRFKKKHRSPRSTYSRTDLQTVSKTSKTRAPNIPLVSPARHHPSRVTPPMPHLSPVSPPHQHHRLSSGSSSSLSSNSSISPGGLYPSSPPQQEKLVIGVEDFFYGTDEGVEGLRSQVAQSAGSYVCDHCHATLQNNISFMSHTQQHVSAIYQKGDRVNHCHHCYRNFKTPFKLQRHLEVHSQNNLAPTCKICELSYETESALLHHMKSTHKPGEMPYICQVCEYRSSFYSSVVRHFREAHVNTNYLLCIYCLRVFRSRAAYQQHVTRHMRKFVHGCALCRLIFLFGKDLNLHKQCCHKTHIKPRQLDGLKPGTKVTVKSQSAEPVQDNTVPSPEQVSHGPGSSQHLNNKEPPVIILKDDRQESAGRQETRGGERRDMQEENMEAGLEPAPSPLKTSTSCIECQYAVSSGWSHFVAGVRCSMCTYVTYCSRAYANHMMSNHMIEKTTSNYVSMYQSYPRLPKRLKCQFCTYMTTTGDMMANHLAEHPGHRAMAVNVSEKQRGRNPGGGSFIPIHLLPAGHASPQLSIKTLPSPSPLPSLHLLPAAPTSRQLPPTVSTLSQWLSMFRRSREGETQEVDLSSLSTSCQLATPPPNCQSKLSPPLPPPPPCTSCQLPPPPPNCINTVPSPSPLPSPGISALTLTFRSPQNTKDSEKMSTRSQSPPPLTVSELQMVLYALCNGVPQAAQCFRTDPALIRAWTLQQAQDTTKDNTQSTWNSDRLAEWVLAQREQQLCVSEDSLMRAATSALKPSSCGRREAYCWAVNFMMSHSLSLQPLATTTDSRGPNRRLPRKLSENAKMFTRFLQNQLQTGLPPDAVGYLDELSIFIDPGRLSSSSSAFSLFSSRTDTPPLVDIMLSGLSDGTCFSPIILYTGTSPVLPEGFPTNITLLAAPDGFTEQRRLDLWHHKVWRPHISKHSRGVLIMDTHRGHLDDHFLSTLSSSHTAPVVIPIGCSSRLQPLDVCITPVVREFLQARWSQLLSYGGVESLSLEQLVVTLCCWLSEVASTLSDHQDILRRSFAMVSATPGKEEPVGANEMIQTLTQALID